MLIHEVSRSGELVWRKDGRLLASLVDPVAEAQRWVEKNTSFLFTAGDSLLIVLGLGAGYHVCELFKKLRPKQMILVLEALPELIEKFTEQQSPDLLKSKSIRLVHLDSNEEWLTEVTEFINQTYQVLAFFPATQSEPKVYRKASETLLARDLSSLQRLLPYRKNSNTLMQQLVQMQPKSEEPLSIQTVGALLASESFNKQSLGMPEEILIWKTLQELVL